MTIQEAEGSSIDADGQTVLKPDHLSSPINLSAGSEPIATFVDNGHRKNSDTLDTAM
jgi:hypothetical protein